METAQSITRHPFSMMPITHDKVNTHVNRPRIRIMVVDDDESFVELWCLAGPYFDLDVTGYTDARSALSVFSQAPDHFDLVVTDFEMAHLDGLALARGLRAVRPDLPVVLSTGRLDLFVGEMPAPAPAGIAALLLKPFTVSELRSAVELALERPVLEHGAGAGEDGSACDTCG